MKYLVIATGIIAIAYSFIVMLPNLDYRLGDCLGLSLLGVMCLIVPFIAGE